ncbi:P-loop containing nucleoside triphosphate hydrolase protein [Cyathus striatus]|nr:P-loop containing nucleoside triphosphate hydrolase protein [Cyathus striatus]
MFSKLLSEAFATPVANPKLFLIQRLKRSHAGAQCISICQCSEAAFPIFEFLESRNIPVYVDEGETHETFEYDHASRKGYTSTVAGVSRFEYDSIAYIAYKATWRTDWHFDTFYHLVFDSENNAPGTELSRTVYQWANSPKDEVWIYEDENWSKSASLYKSIRSSDWDSVVLKDEFREGLRRDVESFFNSRDAYASLDITWKRGILLLGPPGNGKTECIKALLNEFKDVEALYVKSFTTSDGPEKGVRQIFDHARKHAPCILVVEDLDSMVTRKVRSFFLNELDGLAKNEGILTIATTNHPERIDDSILNRPSRFDVKYNFTLPERDIRKTFSLKWIKKVQELGNDTGIDFDDPERTANIVADKTESWSFAFLKELFVSFMLRVAHDKATGSKKSINGSTVVGSETVLLDQADKLASQIIKAKDKEEKKKAKKAATEDSDASDEES